MDLHNYLQTEQPALREWRRDDFLVPASESEADIIDFVQRRAHTVYHPVGTCAMGAVVDASVMPTITRGNTNAPTIMIGQKGADLIRGRLPLPREQAAEEVGA